MTNSTKQSRIQKLLNSFRQTLKSNNSKQVTYKVTFHDPYKITFDSVKQRHSAKNSSSRPWIKWAIGAVAFFAIVGFGGSQYISANTVNYYSVYYDGTYLGNVPTPEDVQDFVAQKTKEVIDGHPDVHMKLDDSLITYQPGSAYKAEVDASDVIQQLDQLLIPYATGVELMVKDKKIAILKDKSTVDKILQKVKDNYLVKLEKQDDKKAKKNAASQELKSIDIVEKITLTEMKIEPDVIDSPDKVFERLIKGEVKQKIYTVKDGDCIGCIADELDIPRQLIYENNPKIENDEITVGDKLDLTVLKPEVTIKTIEYLTETEKIEPEVIIEKNEKMRAGESKVIKEGKSGRKRVTYQLIKKNGYLTDEELIREKVIKKPVAKVVMKGTKVVLGEGTGNFAWPVYGARVSSSYGARWGRMHKGVDLTGNHAIMAADNGIIKFAGSRNGYGNLIIIDHRNGYETYYGHLNGFNVKNGDIVEKGQNIGRMGNTGHSYGTHLHFEIHVYGGTRNPLNYL